MCGIAGLLRIDGGSVSNPGQVVARMAEVQRHRGPDGQGVWTDAEGLLALGHRRLKVLDLSAAGDQPMVSPTGRYVLVFNGQIYNHLALRGALEQGGCAWPWRGHSDTETLLAAIAHWGVRGAVERCVGMFAFAVWDAQERLLSLARDRMGEKPLYVGRSGGAFLFASELKAFRSVPQFDAAIDRDALSLLFWFGYIPAPHSIYRNATKLAPGTILTVDAAGNTNETRYWSLDDALEAPRFDGSAEDAAGEVEALLRDAIRLQCVADVPVGAFLSGGIDSSAVVALMRETAPRLKSFSLGFEDAAYDETPYARAVAAHLGTEHVEARITAGDARALIPRLPQIWDEPFADSSQIPTALLSMLAREQVIVALTGDGGDELFCGYPSYPAIAARERWPAKRLIARMLRGAPVVRLRRLAHQMSLDSAEQRFLASAAGWEGGPGLVRGAAATPLTPARFSRPRGVDLETHLASIDARLYLADDLLVKVDRAAMAASLETRLPLLDHRLVEFAYRLPVGFKIRAGRTKWPLRQLLDKHLPAGLIDRPKHGFSIPLAGWLRGPLRDWAESLLQPAALEDSGIDSAAVARLWRQHLDGAHDHSARLWAVLMFEAWRDGQ